MNSKQLACITAVAAFTLLAACKKTQDMVAPPVVGQQASISNVSATVGSSLTLHPSISAKDNQPYKWTVNGADAGAGTEFVFTPSAPGKDTIVFTAAKAGGQTSVTYLVQVLRKYENGFFVANEGYTGHGAGTVSFYRYNTKILEDSVFEKENPGKTLGPNTSILEYATIFNGKLYLLTKGGGPLVETDAFTLKETRRIAAAPANDFRAFVGIDSNNALVTTGTGVYRLNLRTLTLGNKLGAITGEAGDILKAGNYIFVSTRKDQTVVLQAPTYSFVKKFLDSTVGGYAQTSDGAVWAGGNVYLTKIDTSNLSVRTTEAPATHSTWGAWRPTSMFPLNNYIFLAPNLPNKSRTKIYRDNGFSSSVVNPFFTVQQYWELIGKGINYDHNTNQVVITTVKSGGGTNNSINKLSFYNAATGAFVSEFAYRGYYFPSMAAFH